MHHSSKIVCSLLVILSGLLSGCATTVSAGLKSGDLPPVGDFTAENGLQFNIQPLSLATLPVKQAPKISNDIYQLIETSGRVDYRIAQGDIFSINLVGYR